MGISISFALKELADLLTGAEAKHIEQGGLNGDEVWYEYLTQADDRVRPSHAALHGTRWKADDPNAPTPPLDYGCRCFIRYIAAPDSIASNILPEADGPLSDRKEAFRAYLNQEVDGWSALAKEARSVSPGHRLQLIIDGLVDGDLASASLARDIAFMILSVL